MDISIFNYDKEAENNMDKWQLHDLNQLRKTDYEQAIEHVNKHNRQSVNDKEKDEMNIALDIIERYKNNIQREDSEFQIAKNEPNELAVKSALSDIPFKTQMTIISPDGLTSVPVTNAQEFMDVFSIMYDDGHGDFAPYAHPNEDRTTAQTSELTDEQIEYIMQVEERAGVEFDSVEEAEAWENEAYKNIGLDEPNLQTMSSSSEYDTIQEFENIREQSKDDLDSRER